jgi:hypothetical protein
VGITATQEMQQAARKVASENKRLRMLLGCHGVTDDEINCYLQDFEPSLGSHRPNAKDVVAHVTKEQPTCPVTGATEPIFLPPGMLAPGEMGPDHETEPPQTWYDWTTTLTLSESSSLVWTPTQCTAAFQVPSTETEEMFQQTYSQFRVIGSHANDHPELLAGSIAIDDVPRLD